MFYALVADFISKEQLGDYDAKNWQITLYDIENNPDVIFKITATANSITKNKCKIIILNPDRGFTNIKILDIGL